MATKLAALTSFVDFARRKSGKEKQKYRPVQKIARSESQITSQWLRQDEQQNFNAVIVNHVNGSESISGEHTHKAKSSTCPLPTSGQVEYCQPVKAKSSTCPMPTSGQAEYCQRQLSQRSLSQAPNTPSSNTPSSNRPAPTLPSPSSTRKNVNGPYTTPEPRTTSSTASHHAPRMHSLSDASQEADDLTQELSEQKTKKPMTPQPEEEPVPTQQVPEEVVPTQQLSEQFSQLTLRPVLSEGLLPPDLMRAISATQLPDDVEGTPAPPPVEPPSSAKAPSVQPIPLANDSAAALGQDAGEVAVSGAENGADAGGGLSVDRSKIAFDPADVARPDRLGFRASRTSLSSSSRSLTRSLTASQRVFRFSDGAAKRASPLNQYGLYKQNEPSEAATPKESSGERERSSVVLEASPSRDRHQWNFTATLPGRRVVKPKPRYRRELLSDDPTPLKKPQTRWLSGEEDEGMLVKWQHYQDEETFLQQEQMLLYMQQHERQMAMLNIQERKLQNQLGGKQMDFNWILQNQLESMSLTPTAQTATKERYKEQAASGEVSPVVSPRAEVSHVEAQGTSRLGVNNGPSVNAWWADPKANLLGNRGHWRAPRLWAVGKT